MSEPGVEILGPAPDVDGPPVCTLRSTSPAAGADCDSLTDCSCGLATTLPT